MFIITRFAAFILLLTITNVHLERKQDVYGPSYANYLDNYSQENHHRISTRNKINEIQNIISNLVRRNNEQNFITNRPAVFTAGPNQDPMFTWPSPKPSARPLLPSLKSLQPLSPIHEEPFETNVLQPDPLVAPMDPGPVVLAHQETIQKKLDQPYQNPNIDLSPAKLSPNEIKNLPLIPTSPSNSLNSKEIDDISIENRFAQLRSRWRSKCDKGAYKQCKKACKKSFKSACREYRCRKGLKKTFKRNCKSACKERFYDDKDYDTDKSK